MGDRGRTLPHLLKTLNLYQKMTVIQKIKEKATKEDFDKIEVLMRLNKLKVSQLKQLLTIAEDMIQLNKQKHAEL
ncbi:MAG: hypothetical protein CVU09_00335 [Bacteroidetes bacterium HGW-Bacteroidetes-4]|jgi:hypothetical protein|nr:MAG: hypothetical protein CVU09_00335 [Bacteroidetes bacterium HGW-Bacteroidetes-4]